MRPRTLILFFFALVVSGAMAMLANSWLEAQRQTIVQAEAPPPPPEVKPARSVLVAHKALAMGELLKPDDLVWQPWPDNGNLGEGYILEGMRKPEDLAGWVVRSPFLAGEPIVEGRVVSPGDRGFLAAVLRPGMRAISVAISATSGISGFVFPGDRVDLVLTHSVPQEEGSDGGTSRQASETVQRDIRVLAIDQKVDTKAGEPIVGHTATLEVTEKQAELVTLAAEMGKLAFSLHSLGDDQLALADVKPGANAKAGDENKLSAFTNKQTPTYTVDSQVSRLLPAFRPVGSSGGNVTIIRGARAEVQQLGNSQVGTAGPGQAASAAPK
ncbi:MAG TPA: Flp pilus assembly protein CpaB [Aliidongia sp.]|nr:Flp pilus assembly protein CpaB [Aliidongia sp.]